MKLYFKEQIFFLYKKRVDKHLFMLYNIPCKEQKFMRWLYMKRKSRIKIISKKRFIINIFFILILGICISFFTSKSFCKREICTYEYIVTNTDTLWNISKTVCKNSDDSTISIQDVVRDIKSRNNLVDSSIYVGQVLTVPIY